MCGLVKATRAFTILGVLTAAAIAGLSAALAFVPALGQKLPAHALTATFVLAFIIGLIGMSTGVSGFKKVFISYAP